jgi:hypothetical protein
MIRKERAAPSAPSGLPVRSPHTEGSRSWKRTTTFLRAFSQPLDTWQKLSKEMEELGKKRAVLDGKLAAAAGGAFAEVGPGRVCLGLVG